MTVNNPWSTELGKAEGAAVATTRWTGLLRTLGYTVFIVYVVIGVLAVLGGIAALFSDGASTGLPLIGGGLLIALLGAIIAAPLLAISSYLAMGAHSALADIAHLEQTGRPLNAIGAASPAVALAPAPAPAPAAPPPAVAAPPAAPSPAAPPPAAAAPTAPSPASAPAAAPSAPPPPPTAPAAPAPASASTLPPTGTPQPGDVPGFYDDPDNPGYVRYWGGSMWTDTRMPRP